MYQVVVVIQCISICALFAECWVVFKNWKGKVHAYLFLSCAATLVNNLGYLQELQSRTEGEYFSALRFSYCGRIWIAYALLLFAAELCRIKVPQALKALLVLTNAVTYTAVCTTKTTGLYYKNIEFSMAGPFPELSKNNGVMHHLWNVTLIASIVFGLYTLFTARRREKNRTSARCLLMVMLAILTEGIFVIVQLFKLFPVTEVYDLTMLGFPIGTIFMFIAILRYRLLDTAVLAREYVIDELSEGIIATDRRGGVSYYNKPALMLFPDLETDAQKVMDQVRATIEAGQPLTIRERIYTPETNVLYEHGEEAGKLYSLTDDTEHYRYMAELEEQKQIADDANKAKSSFLANMSHEIRTPINAVLGMDEMILRESREEEIRSYAADIQTAGHTLLSLINDILDFSKIEEGRMEILPTQYELSTVVKDLVNMVQARADKKGLKLLVRVDREVPHILYGDEIRLRQIVLNLLTNAVKYTEKGTVTLEVGFRKSSYDDILLSFRVVDTGIGMKAEDMEKLYSPFARIEEKRNRSIEGTGLGMSIVKQLLALMDSQLKVKSVYGEGSEFFFEVNQGVVKWEPMGDYSARFQKESGTKEGYHELFHAPDAHVLVVDDTQINLVVIRNLLKRTQIKIDTVLSGKEALSAAKEQRYDVIFIDHMMPEMDGIETLHRLQNEVGVEDAVCIALTANAVSGAREMYLEAGFTDYLSKPVDGGQLEEMLRHYLPDEKLKTSAHSGGADGSVPGEAQVRGQEIRTISGPSTGRNLEPGYTAGPEHERRSAGNPGTGSNLEPGYTAGPEHERRSAGNPETGSNLEPGYAAGNPGTGSNREPGYVPDQEQSSARDQEETQERLHIGNFENGYVLDWNRLKEYEENLVSEPEPEPLPGEKLPDWICEMPELDFRRGIRHCGSEEGYLSILKVFHQTAGEKADEIERLCREGDLENYTVKVHALKSSARIIGANALSELAKELENAGKRGDWDRIHQDTERLLTQYRELEEKLKEPGQENPEWKELTAEMRKEAFQTIGEIAECMDFELMEGVLRDLKGYRIQPRDAGILQEIEGKLMRLDWDGIVSILKTIS